MPSSTCRPSWRPVVHALGARRAGAASFLNCRFAVNGIQIGFEIVGERGRLVSAWLDTFRRKLRWGFGASLSRFSRRKPNLTDWSKSDATFAGRRSRRKRSRRGSRRMNKPEPPPKAGDPHPAEEPQGDPRGGARGLLRLRLPRRDHRPDRRARRHVEAEPALLLPLARKRSTSRCWRTRSRNGCSRCASSTRPATRSRRSAATSRPSSRCRARGRRPRGSSPTRSCTARRRSAISSRGPLKALVDEKAAVIAGWIAEGRLAPIDPHHLIMMIWAMTQHYADFDVQVRAVLGADGAGRRPAEVAGATVTQIFFEGLKPR